MRQMVRAGTIRHEQAVSLARLLWDAGGAAVSVMLGNIGTALLDDPVLCGVLRQRPDRIRNFIEENLRLHPPAHQIIRKITRPLLLDGKPVAASGIVHLSTIAANRDPAVFPQPDSYNLESAGSRHLSFGHGAHLCLGNHQARLLAFHFTTALLAVIDSLEPDPTRPFRPLCSDVHRGCAQFPLRWKRGGDNGRKI